MSIASFKPEQDVTEESQSGPKMEVAKNTKSLGQLEDASAGLSNDAHLTEIDINDTHETRNLDHYLEDKDEEDENVSNAHDDDHNGVYKDTEDEANLSTASCEKDTQTNMKVAMAKETQRSPAAELSVTSNGDADTSHEEVFQQDLSRAASAAGPITSHAHSAPDSYGMTEGVVAVGPYTGSASGQTQSGAVVLADDMKSPALEKLELVRKWSINTYKCTKQILSEKLGRGSRTVDLELEAQIEVLRDNKRKYEHVLKLAQTLASQLAQMMQTQRQLGDAFADLSLKSPELHEEFGYNAETQKLLSKNGETLLGAIHFFIASVTTLVDKTIEDTMINIKQYEAARVEYDAYRTDLEELNLGPRDATTLPKIEQSQMQFQMHREKYEKMRKDVSIKLKFLEENKVKVLHNQLVLFHNAIAAYFAGNQQHLEQTLKQFHIKLKMPGADVPSWLEEH
ncbi:arfaptin-1 isoform X2 [Electrophorus electricus]|uniref:AH domain-containing protein n=1 Tax=Electrophorus electricus TaxID=8005 RepID=A0A4W4HS76_ELEEL|nr:arfaptin-1 isoform X2 [Electrophorus electricus]